MREFRQVIWGVLAALVSVGILLGSLSITLVEGGLYASSNATPTRFVILITQPIPTILPSRPGLQITSTTASMPELPQTIPGTSVVPTSSPTPRCSPPAGWSPILVGLGDTLASIAQAYNTTEEMLLQANCLDVDTLRPGTKLYVPDVYPTEVVSPCGPPAGWVFYTVRPGDNLSILGRMFGVTVRQLQFANCLGTSTLIRIGQKLYVPYVPTQTPVVLPTDTPQPAPSETPTTTPSATTVVTFTPTQEYTSTPTRTRVPTLIPTHTSTPTRTPTVLPSSTSTPTILPTNTATDTPLPTSTATDTPEAPTPTATETPLPPSPTNTVTPVEPP